MSEPTIILISFGLATVVFIGIVLLFTLVLDYGYMGICWATFIHLFLRWLIAFTLINCREGFKKANEQAKFFSKATVQNLSYQFRLGLASLCFNVPSWWVTDILLIMATFIGESATGAQTILRGFGNILAVVPFSFSCASGYFIGKAIGEKDMVQIKSYYRVSLCLSIGLGALFCLILLVAKTHLIGMYTD